MSSQSGTGLGPPYSGTGMIRVSEFFLIPVRDSLVFPHLKVPKCEIFDRLDFHDIDTLKSLWS